MGQNSGTKKTTFIKSFRRRRLSSMTNSISAVGQYSWVFVMVNSRQLYWLKIKASLYTLFYIMLVTTSCGVLASEISIARIGPTLEHPWGLTPVGGRSVLVTTRPGSLYLVNTSTQISKKISNTPNVA